MRRHARAVAALATAVLAGVMGAAAPATAAAGDITTIAGGSLGTGLATSVAQQPTAVAVAGSVLYVADAKGLIRAVDLTTGNEAVVAGTGAPGFGGDGTPAVATPLSGAPAGLAVDGNGNLFFTDGNRVRKVDTAGIVSTVAGSGTNGFSGDGGPATAARLSQPAGIVVDATGKVTVADRNNNRVRMISGGVITTVVGSSSVAGYGGDGGSATGATVRLSQPIGLSLGATGTLYIADTDNNRIRRVNAGIIDTVAGNGTAGFAGDGGPATAASLDHPSGVAANPAGGFYVADTRNNVVRRVNAGGVIGPYAGNGIAFFFGDGGPATSASLRLPGDVAVDGSSGLFIADRGNARVRLVNGSGVISTVAGNGNSTSGGDGGLATQAQIGGVAGVDVDAAGNIFFGDVGDPLVRKIDTSGIITTIAGNSSHGFAGDGGPATQALLSFLGDVAVDGSGNVYLVDSDNNRVRKINTAGTITTFAGGGADHAGDGGPATGANMSPRNIAIDTAGDVYIVDSNSSASYTVCRVRKVNHVTNVISTVAGTAACGAYSGNGPATSALLGQLRGIAVDNGGNLFVGDTDNHRLYRIAGGNLTAIGGNGLPGSLGDGGPATMARLVSPDRVAVDPSGARVFVGDASRVRMIDRGTGLIQRAAGTTSSGFSGDGGAAERARLASVGGLALDGSANLVVGDNGNERIRRVSAPIPIDPARYVATDFDADFFANQSVFRPSSGTWYDHPSAGGADTAASWGVGTDIPLPADYDGDHRTDVAIFRPSTGLWAISKSSGGSTFATYGGIGGDVPIPADYDGDGKTDIAIFRPTFGTWFVHRSTDGGDTIVTFGISSDIPVPADYDGDHKTDIAMFRPASATWFVHPSTGGPDTATNYGAPGDIPVPGDYDGDLMADPGIYRPSTGLWSVLRSATGTTLAVTFGGASGDVPVPADYDGDGRADQGIFRPSAGTWFAHRSSGGDSGAAFGIATDVALPLPWAVRSSFFG